MEGIIGLLLLYILIYAGFIGALSYGYTKIKTFRYEQTEPKTTFSIVIPFRDEDQNLPRLLESLKFLDYPKDKLELIFVDDFSDDFSVNVINKWRMENGKFPTTVLENLRLTGSPKKDAITRATGIVVNEWIVTTDADCRVDPNWLKVFDSYIQKNDVEMLAGPVIYDGRNSFLDHFQQMDLMSLQGATIGSFGLQKAFMCNGANFAYTKKLFLELGGFKGNDDNASGDDVFLLQKAVAENPKKVGYLKSDDAIVRTLPTKNWPQLLSQRIRWASKTGSYKSTFGEDLALVVFLGNLSLAVTFFLAVFEILKWEIVAVALILKCIPDFILLIQTNKFLRNGKFFFPLLSAFVYPFFCVIIALRSVFGKYEWKGRRY